MTTTADTPQNDPEPAPKDALLSHLADGITTASLVTVVSYAIVFGFEQGFNTFFQIPSDFVSANLLSVFHVLTLVVFVLIHSPWLALLEVAAGFLLAWWIPSNVYARHPLQLAVGTAALYCASNVFTPIVLLVLAVLMCAAFWFHYGGHEKKRGRLLFSTVGKDTMKGIFVFVLLLTPLFYFGFHYAETQNPRMVFVEPQNPADTSKDAKTNTWVVARILNDSFVAVRTLNEGDKVEGCSFQFTADKRPVRLSRDVRVVKDSETNRSVAWREFKPPLNYCLFGSEKLSVGPRLTPIVLVRQGPGPISDAAPSPSPSPAAR
jgi:hypothetical protein